jgi:hypothetical protein
MDHKWPTRKQPSIGDYNNTSVVKQKKTSAIVGICLHQISRNGSFSVILMQNRRGVAFCTMATIRLSLAYVSVLGVPDLGSKLVFVSVFGTTSNS